MTSWPRVRFDQVLAKVDRRIDLDDSTVYETVGVRWYGLGAFVREKLYGHQIGRKQQWIIRTGDIVYNKLFAWKGAFAVADNSVDGRIVSDKFPTYQVDPKSLDARYLAYYFRTDELAKQALDMSKGGAAISKLTLNPPQFWDLTIPLPPLDEQRRIAQKIERLAGKIDEIRALRGAVATRQAQFQRSLLFGDPKMPSKDTPMSELVRLRQPDVTVLGQESYEFAGIYSFGRGMFRGQTRQGVETSYKRLTKLRILDFVYPKLMAWEGAFAIVPAEHEGLVVSTEFPVFTVNIDRVLPEVLETHFSDPTVWAKVSGQSMGTNVRRRRLHPEDLLKYSFPLPPWQIQAKFRYVKARVVEASRIQAQVDAGLDALLPRILNRAFKGTL